MKRVKLMAGAVILLTAVVYAGDFISFRYEMAHQGSGSALGTVRYVLAAEMKNGKVEVYYNDPQTESCAHSLLPQSGYSPCWYASRQKQRLIAPDAQPMFLPDMRKQY